VGYAVPDGLNGHKQCYECHSPGLSAANLSACGTCHSTGGYNISTPGAKAYNEGFSHATHGQRQRLTCTDCHTVQRSGLPPSQQVSSPATFQHFAKSRATSCLTCHNDKRAFGEGDFGNCKRCHKGSTF
jgi:c(7)-type cytochrome triheme protein